MFYNDDYDEHDEIDPNDPWFIERNKFWDEHEKEIEKDPLSDKYLWDLFKYQ